MPRQSTSKLDQSRKRKDQDKASPVAKSLEISNKAITEKEKEAVTVKVLGPKSTVTRKRSAPKEKELENEAPKEQEPDPIDPNDYFMALAVLSGKRSKDPKTKVGACIIDAKNQRFISTGYNGMPNYFPDEYMPWKNDEDENKPLEGGILGDKPLKGGILGDKLDYVVHAESNALINAHIDVVDCVMYTSYLPCIDCTKKIIKSKIKEVKYLNDYKKAGNPFVYRDYLGSAILKQFQSKIKEIKICLMVPDSTSETTSSGAVFSLRPILERVNKTAEISPNFFKADMDIPDIDWDEYFMSVAVLTGKRSKYQKGACIINKNKRIVSMGYTSDESCKFVSHAASNAVINAYADITGCKIYVTSFPCNECTKQIIQSGIKKVIYLSKNTKIEDKESEENEKKLDISEKMLRFARIKMKKFVTNKKEIVICLEKTVIDTVELAS